MKLFVNFKSENSFLSFKSGKGSHWWKLHFNIYLYYTLFNLSLCNTLNWKPMNQLLLSSNPICMKSVCKCKNLSEYNVLTVRVFLTHVLFTSQNTGYYFLYFTSDLALGPCRPATWSGERRRSKRGHRQWLWW